jgi:hypothetical protein
VTPALTININGIGVFIEGAPDWPTLERVLRGEERLATDAPAPAARVLSSAERRRAPNSVRLAVDVAHQACAMAGRDPASLPCVFASTHGDVAITDYLCATLAATPGDLSPTQFHNSVLNAPAGYWTIATGCTAASSAISAHHRSLAAGLLEAAVLARSDATPILFACCDVASTGPLAEMTRTRRAFGIALVLAPAAAPCTRLTVRGGSVAPTPEVPLALQAVAEDNPTSAQSLALLAALAGCSTSHLTLPLSTGTVLEMELAT